MAIVLLIILYTLACIVLIDRLSSRSKIRLTRKEIAFAYCFKVSLGILYGLLFKFFSSIFPFKRFTVYAVVFFIPSIAFWLSGIRGDAMLLFSIALALYYFYNWTIRRRTIDVLLFFLGLVGIFIFRNQFFFV